MNPNKLCKQHAKLSQLFPLSCDYNCKIVLHHDYREAQAPKKVFMPDRDRVSHQDRVRSPSCPNETKLIKKRMKKHTHLPCGSLSIAGQQKMVIGEYMHKTNTQTNHTSLFLKGKTNHK